MKKIIGAILIIIGIIGIITDLELNVSFPTSTVVDLTLFFHIAKILVSAAIIPFNGKIPDDWLAAIAAALGGIKPASGLVGKLLNHNGDLGAIIPVTSLVIMTVLTVGCLYLAYKTNGKPAGKLLVILTSVCFLATALVVGFVYNILVLHSGGHVISLVTELIMCAATTLIMSIIFFTTDSEVARILAVCGGILTWWPMINERWITKLVSTVVNLNIPNEIKTPLPIFLGILFFEILRIGVGFIRGKKEVYKVSNRPPRKKAHGTKKTPVSSPQQTNPTPPPEPDFIEISDDKAEKTT